MNKFFVLILAIISNINNIFCMTITPGHKISPKEIRYIKNRKPLTQAAIRNIIKINDKNIKLPKIALCFSGGGYRSMISCAGFLDAAEKKDLLSAATCITSLSGSTWLLIALLTLNFSMELFKQYLEKAVNNNFFDFNKLDTEKIYNSLKSNNQNKLIDFWGSILSGHLLGDYDQKLTFKNIRKHLKTFNYYPFPIFSCVIANSKDPKDNLPYNWMEISPYATYAKILDSTVSTKYLGNIFKNGSIKTKNPELPSGFFMGVLGSPFCTSAGDILNLLLTDIGEILHVNSYKYLDWFEKKFEFLKLYKNRICPAQIPNYSYGLKQSKLQNNKNLELIDGGFSFNLPLDPLFRRKFDIIIICDASVDATTINYPELRLAANYASDHGITFPDIEKAYIKYDNLEIFFNPKNPDCPAIIYFTNPIKEPTLKMNYDPPEFENLYGAMQKLVLNNTENIAEIIRLKIKQSN